jgi:hypothetical protein
MTITLPYTFDAALALLGQAPPRDAARTTQSSSTPNGVPDGEWDDHAWDEEELDDDHR